MKTILLIIKVKFSSAKLIYFQNRWTKILSLFRKNKIVNEFKRILVQNELSDPDIFPCFVF